MFYLGNYFLSHAPASDGGLNAAPAWPYAAHVEDAGMQSQ
jgi:hypothetical protein